MFKWLAVITGALRSTLRRQRDLAVENLVLRQQLEILKQRNPWPRLTDTDRLFWVLFSRLWSGWRETLHIVKPETVVRWHRQGFRYYWRWNSRHRSRPKVDPEIRGLIRRMGRANPLWGAPRIHGELLKLGIEVSETTISKYMIRHREPPLWVPIIYAVQFYYKFYNDWARRRGEFLFRKCRQRITAESATMTMCTDLESGQCKASLRLLTAGILPGSVLTRYDLLGTCVHERLQYAY